MDHERAFPAKTTISPKPGDNRVYGEPSAEPDSNEFADAVWQMVGHRRCGKQKFRREYPILPDTADCCCVALKLIGVEVDGNTIKPKKAVRMMNGATGIWPKRGYDARWRIPGYQVLQDPLGMRRLIDSAVDSCLQQFLPSPPTPLPQQAGGEGSQIEQTGRLPVFAGHHERQYVGSVLRVIRTGRCCTPDDRCPGGDRDHSGNRDPTGGSGGARVRRRILFAAPSWPSRTVGSPVAESSRSDTQQLVHRLQANAGVARVKVEPWLRDAVNTQLPRSESAWSSCCGRIDCICWTNRARNPQRSDTRVKYSSH